MIVALIVALLLVVALTSWLVITRMDLGIAREQLAITEANHTALTKKIALVRTHVTILAPDLDVIRERGLGQGDRGPGFDPRDLAAARNKTDSATWLLTTAGALPGQRIPGTNAEKMKALFGYSSPAAGLLSSREIRQGVATLRDEANGAMPRREIRDYGTYGTNTGLRPKRTEDDVTVPDGDPILDLMEDGP